jgi:hypothetical protein
VRAFDDEAPIAARHVARAIPPLDPGEQRGDDA